VGRRSRGPSAAARGWHLAASRTDHITRNSDSEAAQPSIASTHTGPRTPRRVGRLGDRLALLVLGFSQQVLAGGYFARAVGGRHARRDGSGGQRRRTI